MKLTVRATVPICRSELPAGVEVIKVEATKTHNMFNMRIDNDGQERRRQEGQIEKHTLTILKYILGLSSK